MVWTESASEFRRLVPEPLTADPAEVLVAAGMASRRAWLRHPRVARYMAATPEANRFVTATLGVMANLFERLEVDEDDIAAYFHSYCTFMIGAVLFAADRKAADDQLESHAGDGASGSFKTSHAVGAQRHSSELSRVSIDSVMDLSTVDPARDEQLFEQGLRRLVASFTSTAGRP